MLLTSLGKQTTTNTYPCPHCTVHIRDVAMNRDTTSKDVESLTFGMLPNGFNRFMNEQKGNQNKFVTVQLKIL